MGTKRRLTIFPTGGDDGLVHNTDCEQCESDSACVRVVEQSGSVDGEHLFCYVCTPKALQSAAQFVRETQRLHVVTISSKKEGSNGTLLYLFPVPLWCEECNEKSAVIRISDATDLEHARDIVRCLDCCPAKLKAVAEKVASPNGKVCLCRRPKAIRLRLRA